MVHNLNKHGGYKMAKDNMMLATLCVVAALLLGGIVGYVLQPEAKVVTNTVTKTELVNVTSIVEVEVVKDTVLQDKLDEAVALFLEDLTEDFDDDEKISKYTVDEDYTIIVGEDTTEVLFSIDTKKVDTVTESRSNVSYNVSVLFEEEEDPVLTY